MKISKIYFDMDGVLADFDLGVKKLCGLEPIDQSNKTEEQDNLMFAAMRSVPHFYDKLHPKDGAGEMFRQIYEVYGDKCEILSGIPKPHRGIENAREDKINWVHRHLGQDLRVNICYRAEKKNYCSGSDCILFDDFIRNIKEWEKMGGVGILHKNPIETVKKIKELENNT